MISEIGRERFGDLITFSVESVQPWQVEHHEQPEREEEDHADQCGRIVENFFDPDDEIDEDERREEKKGREIGEPEAIREGEDQEIAFLPALAVLYQKETQKDENESVRGLRAGDDGGFPEGKRKGDHQ